MPGPRWANADEFTTCSRGKAIRTSHGQDMEDENAAMNQRQHPGLGTHMLRTHFLISFFFCLSPTTSHELWAVVGWDPGSGDNGVLTCPDKSFHQFWFFHPDHQFWSGQIVGDGGGVLEHNSDAKSPSHFTGSGREPQRTIIVKSQDEQMAQPVGIIPT